MGRIEKQKRQLIEEANKRILNEQNQFLDQYFDSEIKIMDEDTFNLLYPIIIDMEKKNIVFWGKKLYKLGYPVVGVKVYINILQSEGDYNEFTNLEKQRIEKLLI